MYSSKLKINTSIVVDKSVSSGIPIRSNRSAPLSVNVPSTNGVPRARVRSSSNASSSSSASASVVVPFGASSNPSSTSINIPVSHSSGHLLDVHSPYSASPRSPSFPSPSAKNEYVLAMHDYTPQQQNATCLSFRAGQVIHVLNKDPSGWWDGELDGRRGWFPSNYVNVELEYMSDDNTQQMRHTGQNLTTRTAASSSTIHAGSMSPKSPHNAGGSDIDSYCPPLMVQLISVFTVMQDAVHKQKSAHYLPAAAHIVKHVRNILSAMGTVYKSAPVLQENPALAKERKELLQTLAPLIEGAKKASAVPPSKEQDLAVEAMMRCAMEVINRSRRFLIVGVHCGLEIPDSQAVDGSVVWSTQSTDADSTHDMGCAQSTSEAPDIGRTPTQHRKRRERPMTPGLVRTAKSLGDLRNGGKELFMRSQLPIPSLPRRDEIGKLKRHQQTRHKAEASVSSTSSSSLSPQDRSPTIPPPPFPCGPATARQILDVFTYLHDVFLSTNAAFIGHSHAYSQETHASNKVQLCELGNEITDLACKLLTLADAILQHPGIAKNKLDCLRSSQQRLFNLANSFAQIIQSIASTNQSTMDEDQERNIMQKTVTESCKAGADCLSAARVCLMNQGFNHKPLIVKTVNVQEHAMLPCGFGDNTVVNRTWAYDEDLTVQAESLSSVPPLQEDSPIAAQTILLRRALNPIALSSSPIEPDFSSPTSVVRTDDGTTWEGSTRDHYIDKDLEDNMIHEELQNGPSEAMPELPVNPRLWLFSHDYGHDDVAYNSEGLLVGATLEALVEKMTPHDSIVDSAFSAVFFLTFRLFSSSVELVEKIVARYNIVPPADLAQEDVIVWEQRKGLPVRLRISNFIKIWIEFYWRSGVDDSAVPLLTSFLRSTLSLAFPGAAQRILELLDIRLHSPDAVNTLSDRIRDPGMSINPPIMPTTNGEIPRPIMTKTLLVALRKKEWTGITVTDFDATELARQLTIMECNLYCAIQPEEIMETGQQGVKSPVNVKTVTSLSTAITGWAAECVLSETDIKKRSSIIKFFIKVADRCTSLNNYSTPRAILAAIDSSTISRLHQTWLGVAQRHKSILESLRRLADHGRNYHEYRSKLRNTAPPAVPFLGLYLTDVTFCREGNPSHRASPTDPSKPLLNFNKYHKLARIVQDMQRFQVPYNLKAIPEVQEYLNLCFENAKKHGDLQDLYRRSLLVEPKQPVDSQQPLGDMRQLFSWATRSQSQSQPQAAAS
ncbi:hypothetical protein AX15_000010 [Amanita polypyramis BW_CC]|nr:hypothetical protein AX15_000010 [Amanita polypyramis BW_CC]